MTGSTATRGDVPAARRGGRLTPPEDGGYALLTVIGAMFVLTIVSMAALTSAVQGQPLAKRGQSSEAALAAAQAGVADLVTRINLCRDYWVKPSTCAATSGLGEPDASGWRALDPTPDRPGMGEYRVQYLVTPEPLVDDPGTSVVETAGPAPVVSPGLIRAEVTGRVGGVERVLTADLRQPGFLSYIYYTDFESRNPADLVRRFPPRRYDKYSLRVTEGGVTKYVDFTDVTISGVTAAEAAKCNRYYYGPNFARDSTDTSLDARPKETFTGTRGTGGNASLHTITLYRPCQISFSSTDVVNGPMHTNDAILVESGATFTNAVTQTSWPNAVGTVPAPNTSKWYRGLNSSGVEDDTVLVGAGSTSPAYAEPVTLPEQAEGMSVVAQRGCLFTGPTSITFLDWVDLAGTTDELKIRVTSPASTNLPAECGGAAVAAGNTVDIMGPANGVMHVQRRNPTVTCSGKVLGIYPVAGDITTYDCNAGDAFVSGNVKGSFTVSAADDVVVTDDVTYVGGLTGSSVLGLVAEGDVEVYHPVRCTVSVTAPKVCPEGSYANLPGNGSEAARNITIDAAVISMDHSFRVQNYDKGPDLGKVTVRGGIYQRFRGVVGTWLDLNTSANNPPNALLPRYYTGFTSKDYQYDSRLRDVPPPAFPVPAGVQWSVVAFTEQSCSVLETGCTP